VPEVRLVGASGEQIGIVSITDALRMAQEADLDLVEVAPTARPPVCKLMDYGKFKYESALKARESRKNQAQTVIKEIKIRPKIDPHDYGTKKGHVERFLRQGDKVKVTIMFRGREQSRPELGYRLLQQLAEDVEELGFVESQPKQDGRNMIMVIGPHRKKSEARAALRTAEHRGGGRAPQARAGEAPAEHEPARSGNVPGAAGRPAHAAAGETAPPAPEATAPARPQAAPDRQSAPAPAAPARPRPAPPRASGQARSEVPKPSAPRAAKAQAPVPKPGPPPSPGSRPASLRPPVPGSGSRPGQGEAPRGPGSTGAGRG